MSSIECNYEIYDKKLLIIIKTFEKWKSKCAKILIENSIKIFIDHKNLKHFMTTKQLNRRNRRQIRWIEFLTKFNFKIIYQSKVQNIKFDNLIRRFQNLSNNQQNERQQFNHRVLFKSHYFDEKVRNVINFASLLMNENQKKIIILTIMLYELNEKKLFANEKSNEKSSVKSIFENESIIDLFTI